MSAFLELQRTGQVGPQTAALLYRTVAAVVHQQGWRAASGQAWTATDIRETAHDFLTGPRGLRRVTTLYLRATDDESLARLLRRAVVNHLRDQARATDRGALHRRLVELIRDETNDLHEVRSAAGPAVARTGREGHALWSGDEQDLVAAAWSVREVTVVRWRDSSRRAPPADAGSLTRVMQAVVEAARTPVLVSTLVRVFEQRFALSAPPVVVELGDEPAGAERPAEPDTVVIARQTALEVWDQLSVEERLVLAHPDVTVRELAQILGTSKSTAANVRRRLQLVLQRALGNDDDLEASWAALTELAALFARSWTAPPDVTSDQDETR